MNGMIHNSQRWLSRIRVGRHVGWLRFASLSLIVCLAVTAVLSSRTARAVDPEPGPGPGPPPNAAPMIVDFIATEGILEWTFQGRVIDENPMGMRITFGGLLAGEYTSVMDPDGNFYFMHDMDISGQVSAQTVDEVGQSSNVATAHVFITSY